jgi:predicted TIM-barrel fold metal-dependent hydrolase
MTNTTVDRPPPIVDAWAQPALSHGLRLLPEIRRLFEQSGSADVLDRDVGPQQMVALMDAAGIDVVLLSAWHRPGRWVFTNDEVAEFVQAFPNRFVGVAAVDLEKPLQAVKELERAVSQLGFKALRVLPWLWNRPPNDRLYYPLYVKCCELGIVFCTQVGHTGPLMPSEPGRPVPYLDEVALTFPELRIVAGHIGYPWTAEMVGLAWKHQNVFIDTSAYLPRYYPPELLQFMKSYGKDKVLFGTNYPQLNFQKCVDQAKALHLPNDAAQAFFSDNARSVFKIPKSV